MMQPCVVEPVPSFAEVLALFCEPSPFVLTGASSQVGEKLQLIRQKEAQDMVAKRESIGHKLDSAEARRQYVHTRCDSV